MFNEQKQRELIANYPEEIHDDVVYIAQVLAERYNGKKIEMASDLKHVGINRSDSWFYKLLAGKYHFHLPCLRTVYR